MPRLLKASQVVLHFLHFTGCCQNTNRSCQVQMRREFQARLLQLLPPLRLVTAYSAADLLRNLRYERHKVDAVAMSVGCDGQALKPDDLLEIRAQYDGRMLVWGTPGAIAVCAGAPAVEYLEKGNGESPQVFLQHTLKMLKGAIEDRVRSLGVDGGVGVSNHENGGGAGS